MNTVDKIEHNIPDRNSRAALCVILLLVILAMSSCSIKNIGNSDGLKGYTTTDNGYIIYEAEKILVTRQIEGTGNRALTIRSWGLDGQHFLPEEEYLAERPDLIRDLKDGKTIIFSL